MVTSSSSNNRPAWFVGAAYGGNVAEGDQTDRFLQLGVWENGYADDTFSALIDSMQPGDRHRNQVLLQFTEPSKPAL